MTSRRQRYVELVRTRRYAAAANVAALLLGTGLVAAAVARAGAVEPNGSDWLQTGLTIGGGALVSAGLIGLVLGWATKRETTREIENAVNLSMEEVLTPFREAIYDDALCSYRWDCHLAPPESGDPLPAYAYQAVRLSYQLPYLPNELRAICIASNNDDLLDPFMGDDRYVFRWLVDDHLDPADPRVFSVGDFKLDGESLGRPRLARRKIQGAQAIEYRWSIKGGGRNVDAVLELQTRVRKFLGQDKRIDVRVSLFRTVTDAEFRFSVAEGLKPIRVIVHTGEVSRFGRSRGDWSGSTFPGLEERRAAIAIYRSPLQRGSAVAFTLEREPTPIEPLVAPKIPLQDEDLTLEEQHSPETDQHDGLDPGSGDGRSQEIERARDEPRRHPK